MIAVTWHSPASIALCVFNSGAVHRRCPAMERYTMRWAQRFDQVSPEKSLRVSVEAFYGYNAWGENT